MQDTLTSICAIAADAYVFHQDNAPVYRTHQAIEFLQRVTMSTELMASE